MEEFLAFARTEMAGSDASLSLVNCNLSARELDLAAREEAVRAHEKMQTAEEMVLMVRETKVSGQEKALARLADLEESERVYIATIEELKDTRVLTAGPDASWSTFSGRRHGGSLLVTNRSPGFRAV